MLTDTRKSPNAKVHPLAWDKVAWTGGGLWAEEDSVCKTSTIPHIRSCFESDEISHIVKNFRVCAGDDEGTFGGTDFGDGDFYKWMESAIYSAAKSDDRELWDAIDGYIDLIARCQQEDGYLSTKQIIGERQGNGVTRFGDINDFEVYNFGHLCTVASLHNRITGKTNFLAVAEKAADYLTNMYEGFEKTGEVQTAVCPSHYMGLIELYRTTRNQKYLKTAELAIRLRDRVKGGTADNQDRLPLWEQDKIEGHAVRANYLYAGVADLYMETGDERDLEVINRMWENLVGQKLYITGGCGALYNGAAPYGNFWVDSKTHQAYGYEYQLPNVTAYNETCASIGGVMWAYRMFQINPRAEYFDVLERMMLNVNLGAVNLGGDRFFYENMLRRTKGLPYKLVWPLTRKEYISSFCCPPNLARLIAEASEYCYLTSDDSLYVGMYGSNQAHVELACGAEFDIEQVTDYPFDGTISFKLVNVRATSDFKLMLRVPGWATSGTLSVNGEESALKSSEDGYEEVAIAAGVTDLEVDLVLDMPVRFTCAHPYVEEDCNQVAVERGPLVYCIETPDCDAESIDDCLVDPGVEFVPSEGEIAGRRTVVLKGSLLRRKHSLASGLYRTYRNQPLDRVEAQLIPYYAWDNRGEGEMRVWMPVAHRAEG